MKVRFVSVAALLFVACGMEASEDLRDTGGALTNGTPEGRGEVFFEKVTFDGNGRTCATCHPDATGTVSPADAQARFAANPQDPLFRSIDSDDGVGNSYSRLLTHATILVKLPLPPNMKLANDPSATHIVVQRGIPSTLNTPALDPVLMQDGRAPNLEAQALDAINSHYEPTSAPSANQLSDIAAYERTLFSSPTLAAFAQGGPAPQLPEGNTESEKRGRRFFNQGFEGACAFCHSGPMLNETNVFFEIITGGAVPVGSRFGTVSVSELNPANLPVYDFIFTHPDGTTEQLSSPDPGLVLQTGARVTFNMFKTPSLWNLKNTAPYFHDNSAKTVEEMVEHYKKDFARNGVFISDQDVADIAAYVKLL